jgi:ubiquitin-conjugating enzyme E2 C
MSKTPGISAFPEGGNLLRWIATIQGPNDTVYQGLSFKLLIEFPLTYPYAPPAVTFDTTCYHPNVDLNGAICLDILKVIRVLYRINGLRFITFKPSYCPYKVC